MKNLRKNLILVLLAIAVAALSLFAVACKGKTAKLSFEVNGGTAISQQEIGKDQPFTLPKPSRGEDYSFEGWYLTSDFTGSPVTEVTVSEDTTVYAKWEQLYVVNLDSAGGSLSTSKLYLKKGASVYDAVKDLKPTKNGFEFGAWFNGTREIQKNLKMAESAINLVAKYKAACQVEVYLQNTALNGYDKQEVETVYEYVGKTLTLDKKFEGFTMTENSEAVTSITVAESGNLLKAYYDRNAVTLTFSSNNPTGGLSETVRINTYYGVETSLTDECYFELDGYYLSGWATSAEGEIVYHSNFIDRTVYGGDATLENDKVTPVRTTTLYAVWQRGYFDMLGGNDTVFVEAKEGEKIGTAYLKRGSCYFKGTYLPMASYNQHNFEFEINRDERLYLRGRVNPNGSFIYYDESRRIGSFVKFVQGEGVIEGVKIEFDKGNGITYDDNGEKSVGLYTTEGGVYFVEFYEGPKKDTKLEFAIARTNTTYVFLERNEKEYSMGKLKRFLLSGSQLAEATAAQIELDGFFTATMYTDPNDPTKVATLSYVLDGDIITLNDGQSKIAAKIFEYGGSLGYMLYNEGLDVTMENKDGTRLVTDGLYNLTYFDGTNEYKSVYTAQTSYRGGYIVSTTINGTAKKFLVTTHKEAVLDEQGNETKDTVTVYEFTEKLLTYAEYYFKNEQSILIAPLIVLDDEVAGKANIYGADSQRNFIKVATCTYEKGDVISDATGAAMYTFTVETAEPFDSKIFTSDYDFTTIKSIYLALDDKTLTMDISFWYQVIDNEGNVVTMNKQYNSADQLGCTLVVANGMGIYTDPTAGQVIVGIYTAATEKQPFASLQVSGGTLYFEINEEALTFTRLQHLPFKTVRYQTNGTINADEYLALDGKGGAVYTVITKETNPDTQEVTETKTETVGIITSTGLSSNYGSPIMQFTSETLSFKFIQLYTSSQVMFSVYAYDDAECEGKQYSGEAGNLTLDGFGYGATFTDTQGNTYNGMYSVDGSLVRMITQVGYRFFDVTDEGTFTMRGEEFPGSVNGAYILFDNQRIVGRYIHLDGYGKAKIFEYYTPEGSENTETRYIDENATYTKNNDVITINFKEGQDNLTYVGKLSTFAYAGRNYNTFVLLKDSSVVRVYIEDSDWTVLVLDDVGKAVRYRGQGEKETGTYKRITEELIYYVNDEGSDACIYKLDPVKGNIVLSKANPRNFYTETMDTLLFTKFGFVIKDGVNICYYTAEGAVATTYSYDEENPNANEYGFVIEENAFVLSNDQITFEGQTYYTDDGYGAQFSRATDNATNYPIDGKAITTLTFAPSGGESYSTSATVMLGETEVTATVVKDETGFHLRIPDGIGSYRFDVELHYKGTNNSTYTLSNMKRVTELLSYSYMNELIMAVFSGSYVENEYGQISFITEYDEAGVMTADYATGTFGKKSGFTDTLGNILTIENSAYTFDKDKSSYTVTAQMADGYEYELILQAGTFLGAGAYQVTGFIRNETLSSGEYEVVVKRIIASDKYVAGGYYDIELYVSGVKVEYSNAYIVNGVIVYLVTEYDADGNVTSSTHYNITFTDKPDLGAESEVKVVPYESVTVEKRVNEVYYNADKTFYVEIYEGKVVSIVKQTTSSSGAKSYSYAFAKECVTNADGSYTVTLGSGKIYTVTVTEGVATITEQVEE